MPGRSDDHLIVEPRIRRIVRRPVTPTVPAPRREETPAPRVPAPRSPRREEGHLGHTPVDARTHRGA
ncbi:MAG: hypothetical protein AVDCRST_MAG54-161 [uncultured Actinomycetospora sp.]|uniref:Uncharacterized protein n=1 Tax=uncultured Actinomycetospora sp. TaxID=1135996 RepID=A0A6J4H3X8_9PSEU|nr:MAG: hypothetical protein AVDCRST_MAG54-161 [uncultured Actinomycetospora sp.]